MASAGVPGREVARQTHARDDDTPRRLTGIAGVGASLPILLVFGIEGTAFADTINREAVAEQVIAMLVGSIGLILACRSRLRSRPCWPRGCPRTS